MKTALFLGAGASVCVHLPTTQEFLRNLRQKHRDDEFITDILKYEAFTDVEIVYDAVLEMIRFAKSDQCRPLVNKLVNKPSDSKYHPHEIVANKLYALESSIRDSLFDFLKIEPADVREIHPLYEKLEDLIRKQGDDSLKIITTNYDLAVETYCDHADREVVDGFKRKNYGYRGYWTGKWEPESSDPVYLFKLHGSINWYKEYEDETTLVKIGDAGHHTDHYDLLIKPTQNQKAVKYTDAPFSTIMDRFTTMLDEVDILIVIGYSYRDKELNEIIKNRLGKDLVVASFSPSSSEDVKKLKATPLILKRPNLNEISRKADVYSYDIEFNQNTINDIRDVLIHIYDHLNQSDPSTSVV